MIQDDTMHVISLNTRTMPNMLLLSLSVLLCACGTSNNDDTPTPTILKTIASATDSGYEPQVSSTQIVINNPTDWATVWAAHSSTRSPAPALPEVDFKNERVVGVFAKGTNGCYQLNVTRITTTSQQLEVFYTDEDSTSALNCAQTSVRPAQFVSVPTIPTTVKFTHNPPVTHIIVTPPVL